MNAGILKIIGRTDYLFEEDLLKRKAEISDKTYKKKFLVVGGGGTIGQAVVKEIIKTHADCVHVVDISENNLVELVRDVRSSTYDFHADLKTFAIDIGSQEFSAYINQQNAYDYILNLSALKHVRSERDPFTLSRLIDVNIFNSILLASSAREMGSEKYFCVSTDKAANPVNIMGASKRMMELFLFRDSENQNISTARFANVAFSDGSLLAGFQERLNKQQPIAVPKDIRRYFVTPREAGELCLLSCLFGENRDIFFPKKNDSFKDETFVAVATRYLGSLGFEVSECESEDEARKKAPELIRLNKWPCYFFDSDTTGEKSFEEFFTQDELVDFDSFKAIGVVKNSPSQNLHDLSDFVSDIDKWRQNSIWSKTDLIKIFQSYLPELRHFEKNKDLDQKM